MGRIRVSKLERLGENTQIQNLFHLPLKITFKERNIRGIFVVKRKVPVRERKKNENLYEVDYKCRRGKESVIGGRDVEGETTLREYKQELIEMIKY